MPKQITFQVCINIFIYNYYGETRLYKINHVLVQIILSTFYSLTSVILGIWKIPGINTFGNIGTVWRAIKINAAGGNDYTTILLEKEFSDEVNWIWRNILGSTRNKVDRNDIVEILNLQESYESNGNNLYEEQNVQFLKSKLNRGVVTRFEKSDISNIIYALKLYNEKAHNTMYVS